MPWYQVTLSDDDLLIGKGLSLQADFTQLFIAKDSPKDAGLFSKTALGRHDYFFSPKAAEIALGLIKSYAGAECSAPRPSEVNIRVGQGSDVSISDNGHA
ncbi:MAG: hypothetical protein ABSG32_23225 [Terriglobia bacterium]|jgi:hypothetical protein